MVAVNPDPPLEDVLPTTATREPTPHDLIFKTACRYFFADVVELTRPELARRLDLDQVELIEQEAFSDFPKGERAIADLVAKVRLKHGEERIMLVQVEVEGQFRRAMDERAFYYYLYLRLKYRLPLVTIVIFLKGGKASLEVREVFDEVEDMEICRFRYVAFCLWPSRAEDFVDLPQALAPALAALMKSDWDPVEKKLRCLKAISHADIDDARRYVLAKIVDVYVELDETEAARYTAEVDREANKEVRGMVITWEDALAASKNEGKTEGKAEGKAEAARSYIVRVLQQRLSSVPSFIRAKLDAIDSVERLEGILDQAIVVNSADELVLEP